MGNGIEGTMAKFTAEELKAALRTALLSRNPVLIEAMLGVNEDVTGLETLVLKYYVEYYDVKAVEKMLQIKQFNLSVLNDCVSLAVSKRKPEMLDVLFNEGASKETAMRNALQKGRSDHILMLMEAGCECDVNNAIRWVVKGGTGGPAVVTWLIEKAEDRTLDRKRFECVMMEARTYGQDITAEYMKKCLKIYSGKFAPVPEKKKKSQKKESNE